MTISPLLGRIERSSRLFPTLMRPFRSSTGKNEPEKTEKAREFGKHSKEDFDRIKKLVDRNFPPWRPRKCNRWVFFCRVNEWNFRSAKDYYDSLSPTRKEVGSVLTRFV